MIKGVWKTTCSETLYNNLRDRIDDRTFAVIAEVRREQGKDVDIITALNNDVFLSDLKSEACGLIIDYWVSD